MDKNNIYTMIEPFGLPSSGESFHYRLNILNSDYTLLYALVWTECGNVIQLWEDGVFINNIDMGESIFAEGNVYEAVVPVSILIELPEFFYVEPAVWHDHKNSWDDIWTGNQETSIEQEYNHYSLEILCSYAEEITLSDYGLLPIALALSEGYIYKMVQPELKQRVINDGIEMIRQADKSLSYSFGRQEQIKDLDLAALLVWANRSTMYGGYNSLGYNFYSADGKLNVDAYEFMVLQPELLDKCRILIEQNNLLDTNSLENTIYNIETWLINIQKYRRVNFDDIVELYEAYPDNPYFENMYEESLWELNNNKTIIASINE